MNELFLRHEYAYMPNICSDFFYAIITGCKSIYYDAMDIYGHNYNTFSIIPSYHKDKVTPTYHKFDNMLKKIFQGDKITEEQFYISCKILLELRQSISFWTAKILFRETYGFKELH